MSMDNKGEIVGAIVAWGGTIAQVLSKHFSLLLSLFCAGCAIGASIYSMKVSRAKLRHFKAHDEAVCIRCGLGDDVECPYPIDERPDDCLKKYESKENES